MVAVADAFKLLGYDCKLSRSLNYNPSRLFKQRDGVWYILLKLVNKNWASCDFGYVEVFCYGGWHRAREGAIVPAGKRFVFDDGSTAVLSDADAVQHVRWPKDISPEIYAESVTYHAAVYNASETHDKNDGRGVLKDNQAECDPILVQDSDRVNNEAALRVFQQMWPLVDKFYLYQCYLVTERKADKAEQTTSQPCTSTHLDM